MTIRALQSSDIPAVKRFTDRAIGDNYYSLDELQDIYSRSHKNGKVCSLVLVDEGGHVRGIRFTFPPGQWSHGKGEGLTPEKWKVPLQEAAYFQSLFIDPQITSKGWGRQMSTASLEILRQLGARAVVCHSWKESPNDSSGRYLRSLGFEFVNSHPHYWKNVNYNCTRCKQPPCLCTAEEMIKYL